MSYLKKRTNSDGTTQFIWSVESISDDEWNLLFDYREQKNREYWFGPEGRQRALRTVTRANEALAEPPNLFPDLTDEDLGVGEPVVVQTPTWKQMGYANQEAMRIHGHELLLAASEAHLAPPTQFHEVMA